MIVREVMHRNFLSVQPQDSLEETMQKMREREVRFALVWEDDVFRGVLTDAEIRRAIASGGSPCGDDGNRCHYFNEVMVEEISSR